MERSLIEINGVRYVGYTEAALAITENFPDRPRPRRGSKGYTRQQVHVWYLRRDSNGFPERYPVTAPHGAEKELFKLTEVLEWFNQYKPVNGQKPASEL